MSRLFHPDGLKNIAITKLSCELVWQIGRAVATVLDLHTGDPPEIFIAMDTRSSSAVLQASLCAGICCAGGNAVTLGVLPTNAVSCLVKSQRADAGIMISAGSRPAEFNGIQLFSRNGLPMSDPFIEEIESLILDKPEKLALYTGEKLGRISSLPDSKELYFQYLQNFISSPLDGLKIAIDCGNGSASAVAQEFYSRLGAEVTLLYHQPDGNNINQQCGTEYTPKLMDFIAQHPEFHAGLAFDGSAECCLAVDENAKLLDGDQILAILADDYQKRQLLKQNSFVMTTVSNLGLTDFAKKRNIRTITANSSGKHVLEQMLENTCSLGGAPNGHICFLEAAPLGDALLTGAELLSVMQRANLPLSSLASVMHQYLFAMMNIQIPPYFLEIWKNDPQITDIIAYQEAFLGQDGRLLVRESSSDSMIRILAQGNDFHQINQIVTEISAVIRQRIAENS